MKSYEKVPYLPSYEALRNVLLYPSEWLSDCLHPMHPHESAQIGRVSHGDSFTLEIEGVPIAKARARTVKRGNFVMTYDPQEKEKQQFRQKLKMKLDSIANIDMEASNFELELLFWVDLTFHMEIGHSSQKVAKNAKLWGFDFFSGRPDLDNLEKFVLDCANGILFPDDSMIIGLSSRKIYSEIPKTVIRVTSMKKPDLDDPAKKILSQFSPEELVRLINLMRQIADLMDSYKIDTNPNRADAFCQLIAHKLVRMMKEHGKELNKIAKIDYSLSKESAENLKEIFYGISRK